MMTQEKSVRTEFIALMACVISLSAFSIDTMLPALGQMGKDLGVQRENDVQFIISTIFIGLSLGLLVYGPLSDSIGRIKTLNLGIGVFIIGSCISYFATDFDVMIVGRLLQGFGCASCRVNSQAMIRDQFSGKAMSKIMSFIMLIFVIVPAIAPTLGQFILTIWSWRAVFAFFLFLSLFVLAWLNTRQEETLKPENRIPITRKNLISGAITVFTHKTAMSYTIAAGILFSSFIAYLSSTQQLFQIKYELHDKFPIFFGCMALNFGISSFVNTRLLKWYSMERICFIALSAMTVFSIIFAIVSGQYSGLPPFSYTVAYLAGAIFCFGLIYTNMNTLAISPLGHIAGMATSIITSVQTLISAILGAYIGSLYDGTVYHLAIGFLVCSGASIPILAMAVKKSKNPVIVET